MTVYVSIGNSDDKLTQRKWCEFVEAVESTLDGLPMHGIWFSRPDAMWQNACFCIDVSQSSRVFIHGVKERLAVIAAEFGQDSIAWAEAETEFLRHV